VTQNSVTESVELPLRWWKDARIKILAQILLLIVFSAVAAFGKQWAPSLQIPGSSGLFWLTPLILGRMLVKRHGGGTLMGLGMAGWGMALGFDKPLGTNVALYGITGLVMDLACGLPPVNIRNVIGAIVCGLAAHMVKFGFVVVSALSFGGSKHFMVFGLAKSALSHAGVGIASAIIAWALFKGGQRLFSRGRST
jgi:hypothetical protein